MRFAFYAATGLFCLKLNPVVWYNHAMKAKSANHPPRTILLATVGMSPAVLTETVWALANPEKRKGSPQVVPDQVIAITTTKGKAAIEKLLLGEDGGWNRMVRALKNKRVPVEGKLRFGSSESIRLLSTPDGKADIEDLRTKEDNLQAADFFLSEIHRHVHTKEGSVQLYTSIAGGRKTMGALLLSCMSLLGREQDHVLHVLVNEPFEKPMDPPFLFPEEKERVLLGRDGKPMKPTKTVSDKDARLDLIDLPFVKMSGLYEKRFGPGTQPTYLGLVEETQGVIDSKFPDLEFDFRRGGLFVEKDNAMVKMSCTDFLLLAASFLRPGKDAFELAQRACECDLPPELQLKSSWIRKFRRTGKNPFFSDKDQFDPKNNDARSADKRISYTSEFWYSKKNHLKKSLEAHAKLKPHSKQIIPERESVIPPYGGRVSVRPGSEKLVDALFGPAE